MRSRTAWRCRLASDLSCLDYRSNECFPQATLADKVAMIHHGLEGRPPERAERAIGS
jgi:hypothetical protein